MRNFRQRKTLLALKIKTEVVLRERFKSWVNYSKLAAQYKLVWGHSVRWAAHREEKRLTLTDSLLPAMFLTGDVNRDIREKITKNNTNSSHG